MLRITAVQDRASSRILKLEGKLLEPWIAELQAACRLPRQPAALITLDLAGISYVDASGTIALRDLRRGGVKLTGCSPLITELLKENDP